ncbi:MAG: hypothetical protein R2845_11190 [Thermomicrobiales bacterium]
MTAELPGPDSGLKSICSGWTELYGASNPHPVSGGHLFALMGTLGRDTGWHAGVSFSPDCGDSFAPPVIIAQADDRDYSDIDVIRLADGRFLAVIREHLTANRSTRTRTTKGEAGRRSGRLRSRARTSNFIASRPVPSSVPTAITIRISPGSA